MKISKLSQIDRNKLADLFRQRGHGVIDEGIAAIMVEAIEGRRPDLEVFQCKCGELMVVNKELARRIAATFNIAVDNIPCKVCGNYKDATIDLTLKKALDDIMEGGPVKTTQTGVPLNPVLGLIPASTPEEFTVGISDLVNAIQKDFPSSPSTYQSLVEDLVESAQKNNSGGFEVFLANIIDFQDLNVKVKNLVKALKIAITIKGDSSKRRLFGEPDAKDDTAMWISSLHAAYVEMVEEKNHLEILENLRRLRDGLPAINKPFDGAILPPVKPKAKPRKVDSLAHRIEHLEQKLPHFKLGALYRASLRNSKSHNDYEIDEGSKQIVLLKYGDRLSFYELESIVKSLLDLIVSIDQCLNKYIILKLRGQHRMLGIIGVMLGYTNPAVVGENLSPVGNCLPELNILQAWDFSNSNPLEKAPPELQLSPTGSKLEVKLDNGAIDYSFDLLDATKRWLKQLILTGSLNISVWIVSPVLPIFFSNAKLRVPFRPAPGREIYVHTVTEKQIQIDKALVENFSRSLNFSVGSPEAAILIEEAHRLEIAVKHSLVEGAIREAILLSEKGYNCTLIQPISSFVGSLNPNGHPKSIFIEILEDSFERTKTALNDVSGEGSESSISVITAENVALLVCKVTKADSAVVFPLQFSADLIDGIRAQYGLDCYFRAGSDEKSIGLMLRNIKWSEK